MKEKNQIRLPYNKKEELNEYPEDPDWWDESRMDIIGQNGPTGQHYLIEEGNTDE